MSNRRDVRRLAMQVLYQLDLRGYNDLAAIEEGFAEHTGDEDAVDAPETLREAVTLAKTAWHKRHNVDDLSRKVAPQWPPHRQPAIDRAILRLAHHEMVTGRVPARIAINEAIELARSYGGEQSSRFINAVLDKMARELELDLGGAPPAEAEGDAERSRQRPTPPRTGDAWLDDALRD